MEKKENGAVHAAVFDLNGLWRGKRYPEGSLEKLVSGSMRMPISILTSDIWGRDVTANPLILEHGDADGLAIATGRGPISVGGADLVPMWFVDDEERPHKLDPRGALFHIAEEFKTRGLTAGVGTELEFYLVEPESGGLITTTEHTLSLAELERLGPFFDDVEAHCKAHDIQVETGTSEFGPGQCEVVLKYGSDIVKAADDLVLAKHIIRHVARAHGVDACFMAKPIGTSAGNGLHAHVSLSTAAGNLFANGLDGDTPLKHAISGLLRAMPASTLFFAPHFNSYRRFVDGMVAPVQVSWGVENRTVAVRVADADGPNIRLEHRVAGVDANPYLVLSAILQSILKGLDEKFDPGEPIKGNAYETDVARLPNTWTAAIKTLSDGLHHFQHFDPLLTSSVILCKRQELRRFTEEISDFERQTYGRVI